MVISLKNDLLTALSIYKLMCHPHEMRNQMHLFSFLPSNLNVWRVYGQDRLLHHLSSLHTHSANLHYKSQVKDELFSVICGSTC